jgi:hypothetical protein
VYGNLQFEFEAESYPDPILNRDSVSKLIHALIDDGIIEDEYTHENGMSLIWSVCGDLVNEIASTFEDDEDDED